MKKITLILIIIVLLFTVSGKAFAANDNSVVITVKNSLPFASYKVVSFSYTFNNPPMEDVHFALFDKGKELPLEIVSIRGNTVNFKTILNLKPSSSELLVLKYGKSVRSNYKKIFVPNFSGTKFVGIGSGELFIVSLKDNNKIKVTKNNGEIIYDGLLSKKQVKIIPLPGRDTIFTVNSNFPIFAEVSSLKPDCLKSSSDDVSSVFGTYFVLYIPKELVVSSYATTHLSVSTVSGRVIYSSVLPPRGQYKNFNLQPGFYEISADNPVTVQFGCEDDNIYAINYGSLNSFKGVSYGNIVCSALFPNTKLKIKTASKTYSEITLQNRGDYIYKQLITTFEDNKTEVIPVYVTYSNPILIYSDSNHGNIGGEQIPSVYGNGKVFSFLTGKIFNFNGLVHRRKVVIIPAYPDTHVTINNKKVLLEKALSPKIFLFPKSYTPVSIVSDKPVSVFDIGMTTSIEFLSMLLPLEDINSISVVVGKPGESSSSGSKVSGSSSPGSGKNGGLLGIGRFLSPVIVFFTGLFDSALKIPWVKNVLNTLQQFNTSISPYLKELSHQIIALFMPAAQMIYPYIHSYLPDLSQEQLAAIIFYILIAFIIILLIPKRRKKKVPVVKIKEEKEIKKKSQLAFNVKTIEEKGSGVKFGAPGRPKTLPPKKRTEDKKRTEENNRNLPSQAPPFKRPSIKPTGVAEGSGELGKQISALYKKPGVEGKGKLRSVKPTKEISEESIPEVRKVKRVEKKESFTEVDKTKTTDYPVLRRKVKNERKIAENNEISTEKNEKKSISEKSFADENKIVKEKSPAGESVDQTSPVKNPESEEVKGAESAFSKLFKRKKPTSVDEGTVKETTSEREGGITEEESSKPEEPPIRTSLDELLARVKEVSDSQKVNEKPTAGTTSESAMAPEQKEKIEEEKKKKSEELGAFGIKIANSIVIDKDSVDFLVRGGLIRHMSRIFISAKDQAEINAEIKEKYRFGVISLTPIELRIAEDLARRIGAKRSTGEVLLIARKVGVKQILVNDNPKIKDYQGIKIVNVRDIAN